MDSIDLTADIIDIRDIIERFEELESLVGGDDMTQEDASEFVAITAILEDLKGNGGDEQWRGDWYPITLIRDSYFNDSMDELLEDCGELPKDLPPYLSIVVDYVALKMDYTSVTIDGVDYWYR